MHSTPHYHLKSGHPMKHRTLHEKRSIYEVFVVEKNQIVPIRCFKDIFSRGNVQSITDFINYVKAAQNMARTWFTKQKKLVISVLICASKTIFFKD